MDRTSQLLRQMRTLTIIKTGSSSGVADGQGRFVHVSKGYAGSIHDARVLRMSSLTKEV